jgi:concentrative nucleoside transporter, CNT family
MHFYNLVSFSGIFVLLGFAWLCSSNRRRMNWRVVGWGLAIQFVFAAFIFLVPAGTQFFSFVNRVVLRVLDSASAGSTFLFGALALPPGTAGPDGTASLGYFFAFQGLPTVVFFSALMGLLYYFGVMQRLVRAFAWLFTRLMRVSGAESLCVASEIFVGIESSLAVRPHLERMTRSELTTILTAGMATVASNVLAVYVFMLKPVFPAIAGHVISASFLAAPSALVMSKILLPEEGTPETLGLHVQPAHARDDSAIEAVVNGATAGVKLIVGICALLLAFLGLVALTDLLLKGAGGGIGRLFGLRLDWSLRGLLGVVFYPFTLIIGIPPADAAAMARIIGERLVVTEVTAYRDLAALAQAGAVAHPRSFVIATYALCGFAHVASLAIFVGGISALAPSRRSDLARLGPRALFAATLACLLTAAVAGTFYHGTMLLDP